MTILYGIKNCDTVKKARKWLESEGIDYKFHDFRIDGLDKKKLQGWAKSVGWETLLNKRGTTWRQLPEKSRETIDEGKAVTLMLSHPTLVKRPVLVHGKKIHIGFKPADYKSVLR
jgi:arsenate reductase (glutaredoxin)